MGKSLPISATARLQQFTRNSTEIIKTHPNSAKPTSQNRLNLQETAVIGGESRRRRWLRKQMENNNGGSSNGGAQQQRCRTPLSMVVSNCVKRWFQDTLKEAKAGDISMQVLVGQMYFSGYGVPKDAQKGRLWMTRASRVRSSVWKVSSKQPGYNASDSDSDDQLKDGGS